MNLKAHVVGKFLKGFFPRIAWPFKVSGKLQRRMHEGHTLPYIDYSYF